MSKPQKLRIVHVDTGLSMRGGQRQLLLLARGLRERGHSQLIVAPEDSPLLVEANAEDFHTLALPRRDPAHARGIRKLRRKLREEAPHVIHAHDGAGQTIAWLASMGIEVKRVASRRVTFLPRRKIDYRLKYQHTAHAVIAVSEFVKQIATSTGVEPSRVEVISDGIELPQRLPDAKMRAQARERWGLSPEHFVAGFLASSAPEKGQDIAEQAFNLVARALPKARLVVAGHLPSEAAPTRRHAGRHDDRICRLGYQRNLDEFFAGLDLFLMPSRSEGLGSSAIIAMARGVPVVASRVGGLPEIVLGGKTGWLVAPESPESLAGAILAAARDLELLRKIGGQARRHARNFSAERMTTRTEALYYRVLGYR